MKSIIDAINLEKQLHPKATSQDISKLIYQACFGNGHMITSVKDCLDQLKQEVVQDNSKPSIQNIGNGYVRVSCSAMKKKEELYNLLFVHSSKQDPDTKLYQSLLMKYDLQPSNNLHHSKEYVDTYDPHYRVIKKEYIDYIKGIEFVYKQIQNNERILICIEGPCASGKTTFSNILHELFSLTIFHMDDYFLQPFQRVPERLEEIGGNVDYERVKKEIFDPWSKQENIVYQRYNCQTLKLEEPIHVPYKDIMVIEGSYSCHPYFKEFDTRKIWIDLDSEEQINRLEKRSKNLLERFIKEWIPKENAYFKKYDIKSTCDVII